MRSNWMLTALIATCLYACCATAREVDFYKNLRYPAGLVPGVGRDKVEQEGGADAAGYRRRTVTWWPRKGQDVIDVPHGAPLRTWTRNKGREDPEALAGLCRNWTTSDSPTFKAHLVVLKTWRAAWPKLQASISQEEHIVQARDEANFPSDSPGSFVLESKHWRFQTGSKTWFDTFYLLCPQEPDKQARYRKGTLEFAENLWTYVETSGAVMPWWREHGPRYKYCVTTGPGIKNGWERLDPGNGGGYGCCTLYWCGGGPRNVKLSHEFFHARYHGENGCNAGIHMLIPGELQMFSHNFCYPWRNVMFAEYQAGLWMAALGDNPNWGQGIVGVLGSLRSVAEPTLYHAVARLGQRKGLWKNGIKGLGDFFGEYAARMVTVDFIEQPMLRAKYGMPEVSYVYPAYGQSNTFRIPNSEAPRAYGFNIIRLTPDDDARQIAVDFRGFHEPKDHSDWRACIVAVDGNGRARYSPLWNKGKTVFALKRADKHVWLTVAAAPSALPVRQGAGWHGSMNPYYRGKHAPRFPWEVTLAGCKPSAPHRRQGDVVNLDELYTINNTNFYVDHAIKHEVPIPPWHADAALSRTKLAAMLPRIKAAADAVRERLEAGEGRDEYWMKDWYEYRKLERLDDLRQRVKFLQRNTAGRRHANGGGFVADNAHAAKTAYVGPNAMVLDGARVEGNACIKQYAVVIGPGAAVSGSAKIGGKAWVLGRVEVGGNARILESVVVTASARRRGGYHVHSEHSEGKARITGSAVIKGEHIMRLCHVADQVLTGGLVVDYTTKIGNRRSGVFQRGRFCRDGGYNWAYTPAASFGQSLYNGPDAGALYANWQFDQPKSRLLEDSYVNNNGILHGGPEFSSDGGHRCVVFNGTDQYAEAPPSVADFGELTIDVRINWSGGKGQYLFDFGTGEDECFYLTLSGKNGKLELVAVHDGKTHRLASSKAVTANQWATVRVEMNGSNATIHVDGKRVARGAFRFRPRDVFIGDRAEGNFIGCDRNKTAFFKGRMDHFRIYRKVHDDFDALGQVPLALTQVVSKETCDKASERANSPRIAEWRKRQEAKYKELTQRSEDRKLAEEEQQLNRRKSQILNTSDTLADLNKKRGTVHARKGALDRKVLDKFNALEATREANREIGELRKKIDAIRRKTRDTNEFNRATDAIRRALERIRRALGAIRREFLTRESQVGELKAEYTLVLAEIEAVDEAIRAEKKRMLSDNLDELARIGKRLNELFWERKHWRLDKQGLARQGAELKHYPFDVAVDKRVLTFQQGLKYRTTADWDYRTREEVRDDVPPTMKQWLERVRGY